ncbi:hypothetical protein FB565_008188 [Actinoplanes lutulentus]|uniref:Uncharacterized protein n=1 Tax=Actinoplanes lutulentus TaxID=1287878 RepID=A0A327ZAV5_9ACTN|nr:hypothetical protein [Actinoplanes lutulentus]MBB2948405.1 hypothetical protein [Actinoplanes lutulentus]RAK34562.1 hypothetical protein B0I29_111164 [Actinoplanes lutulentus]
MKPSDYVLAALFSVAGAGLMIMNISGPADPSLIHPVDTTSWLTVPAFLLVTVPILWRRRNIAAVVGVTAAMVALHVLIFGYLTRCGVVLPLSAALAYAVARFAGNRNEHLLGLAGIVVAQVVMLWRDSSAGVTDAMPIAIALAALFYGAGLLVQNRLSRKQKQSAAVQRAAA